VADRSADLPYFRGMTGPRILFFGRNAAMMTLVDLELSAAELNAKGFQDEKALMLELDKGDIRLLVIGGGVEEAPRDRLKAYCKDRNIQLFEHFGGPNSLVENITAALV
jgi:hypothetical protein